MQEQLGSKAKKAYSSVDVVPFFESLYAQQFQGITTPGMSSELFSQIQSLTSEYRVLAQHQDPVFQSILLTSLLTDMLQSLDSKVVDTLNEIYYDGFDVYES